MATTLSHLIVKLDADIAGLEKGTTAATRSVQNMGKRMQSVGKGMSAAVTLPLVAIGVASTKMAADAEEAANKFDVVMGDSAERVNARLKELHSTIPLTTAQMQGLAAGVQDMLVPMGVARSEAADMSAGFVELAGDLGSFNNVDAETVLQGIQSALAGQSEPLRRYGIDVSKARLKTLAFKEGLIEEGAELTRTAQAQAIMLAIQADSTDAMGDAAATAGSAANSFKFFARNARDLGEAIGKVLLPIVTPMIQKMTAGLALFQNLSPTTQKVVVAVAALAAAMGPLLLAFGTVLTMAPAIGLAFTAMTGPVGLALISFAALTAAGVALYKNWDQITAFVGRMVDAIRTALVDRFNAIVESVRGKVDAVTGFFRDMYDKVVGNSYVPDMIDGIGTHFGRLDSLMVDPALSATGKVRTAFQEMSEEVRQAMFLFNQRRVKLPTDFSAPGKVSSMTTAKPPAAAESGLIDKIGGQLQGIMARFGPAALALAAVFDVIKGAMEPLQPVIDALREPLRIVGMLIGQTLAPIIELLVPIIEFIAKVFTYAIQAVGAFVEGLGRFLIALPGGGKIRDWGRALRDSGKAIQANAEAARKSIGAQEETAEAAERLAAGMINAVRGFKVAAYAHGATAVGGGTPAAAGGGGGGAVTVPVTINTSGDGRETYRKWYEEVDQRTRGAGENARSFFRALPEPV